MPLALIPDSSSSRSLTYPEHTGVPTGREIRRKHVARDVLHYASDSGGLPAAVIRRPLTWHVLLRGKLVVAWIAVRCSWTRAMCWRAVPWRGTVRAAVSPCHGITRAC